MNKNAKEEAVQRKYSTFLTGRKVSSAILHVELVKYNLSFPLRRSITCTIVYWTTCVLVYHLLSFFPPRHFFKHLCHWVYSVEGGCIHGVSQLRYYLRLISCIFFRMRVFLLQTVKCNNSEGTKRS